MLADAVGQRRLWSQRIDTLAALLTSLAAGEPVEVKSLTTLAEALIAEAVDGSALRFLSAPVQEPAASSPAIV